MWGVLASRISRFLLVTFGVSTLVFFLIHLVPGDPVEVMLGESASVTDREAMRVSLNLHLPIWQQLALYYQHLFQLDLGTSLHSSQPVVTIIMSRLGATIELAIAALIIAILLAIPLGTIAAKRHRQWPDYLSSSIALFGISVPNFVAGPVLILLFAIYLGWLPVSGRAGVASMVLPALTLGTAMAAILSRMLRSSLLDVMHTPYVLSARARGLSETRILFKHIYPNAMLPVITLLGLQLGGLLAGAIITETIFSWPGIGLLTIEAIQKRDYPLVQGCVILISVSYILVNMCTDILYRVIDPRIREAT